LSLIGSDELLRQVASFKEALHELSPDIPLVLQPGNHDVGQSPTPADIERYRQRFGDDYFEFWVGGVLYIALNSQYYRDDSAVERERLEQDAWVERTFASALERRPKHVVMLSHVPPFVHDEEEQPGWANWPQEPRRAMLSAAGKVGAKLWLCGHYHGNSHGVSSGSIEVVTTSSCGGVINWTEEPSLVATQPFPDFSKVVGTPPVLADASHSGMRLVRVTEHGFSHRWFELADVPATFEDAFAPRSRAVPSKAADRFGHLADVMGLSPATSAVNAMRGSMRGSMSCGSIHQSFGTQSSIATVAAQLRARESARKMGHEGVDEEEEEDATTRT
jgi:hypothetical protein